MNLFEIFNTEEREKIEKVIGVIENKDYTKDELNIVENKILEDIMCNSKNNISKIRAEYNEILNKLESYNR